MLCRGRQTTWLAAPSDKWTSPRMSATLCCNLITTSLLDGLHLQGWFHWTSQVGRLQQQSSINAPYNVIDRRTKWMGKENIGLASKTLLSNTYQERRFCDGCERFAQPTKTLQQLQHIPQNQTTKAVQHMQRQPQFTPQNMMQSTHRPCLLLSVL